jgi:hypothetical protein
LYDCELESPPKDEATLGSSRKCALWSKLAAAAPGSINTATARTTLNSRNFVSISLIISGRGELGGASLEFDNLL